MIPFHKQLKGFLISLQGEEKKVVNKFKELSVTKPFPRIGVKTTHFLRMNGISRNNIKNGNLIYVGGQLLILIHVTPLTFTVKLMRLVIGCI